MVCTYDIAKTVANVKLFFKNDFWHFMNEGGMHPEQLSSPIISDMPVNHSNINTAEKTLIKTMSKAEHARFLAVVILLAVKDCTNGKDTRHQDLIMNRFIKRMSVNETEVRLSFSEYQFRKELTKALCEFAERFNFYRNRYGVADDLDNLIVRKK